MGQALRLAGRPAEARHWLDAAEARDALTRAISNARTPEKRADPAVLRSIAAACEALDRRPEARAWYRLALTRDPTDAATQAAIFRLGTAGPTFVKPKS